MVTSLITSMVSLTKANVVFRAIQLLHLYLTLSQWYSNGIHMRVYNILNVNSRR